MFSSLAGIPCAVSSISSVRDSGSTIRYGVYLCVREDKATILKGHPILSSLLFWARWGLETDSASFAAANQPASAATSLSLWQQP